MRTIKYIAHLGLHHPVNAGDCLLFHCTRELFDYYYGDQHWKLFNIRTPLNSEIIQELNRNAKAIVIGGGGMIADKGFDSGWQFNCSLELLRQIQIPIIIFGVGYNLFEGQELSDKAKEHLKATAEKAFFFGVREKGTVGLLQKITQSKVVYQPCPTTILNRFMPLPEGPTADRIAFNWAGDGAEYRIGAKKGRKRRVEKLFDQINNALDGYKVDIVQHLVGDDLSWEYLKGEQVDLHRCPPKTILNYYRQIPLTIGMRAHSQMIPFGLGNGFIGLVSHPKVERFLADVGFQDHSIDLHSGQLVTELRQKIEEFNSDKTNRKIEEEKGRLWEVTLDNLFGLRTHI